MRNNIPFSFKKILLEEWNSDINYICKSQLCQTVIVKIKGKRERERLRVRRYINDVLNRHKGFIKDKLWQVKKYYKNYNLEIKDLNT